MKHMKKKISKKTLFGIVFLVLFTGLIGAFGYRVIVLSNQLPGRLVSLATAVENTGYQGYVMSRVKKPDYSDIKYGYMNDIMLAQMDYIDKSYEEMRKDEIRAANDLTAMMLRTEDVLAYEAAKAEQEKQAEIAKRAAEVAEKAKEEKLKMLQMMALGQMPTGNGGYSEEDTRSNGGRHGKPVYAKKFGKSLGEYVITAYCTCKVCCGIYSGHNRTASGTIPTTNRTIAVDTKYIPFGTKVIINGQIYVAEDLGGDIKGKRIDMFFFTHKEALNWGRQTIEVFLAK